MKMEYLNCGSNIHLYLNGSKNEIESKFMSLWNHGATNRELEWVNDERACFWTTKPKLFRALVNSNLFRLLAEPKTLDEYRGKRGGCISKAREAAEEELSLVGTLSHVKWRSNGFSFPENLYSVSSDIHAKSNEIA